MNSSNVGIGLDMGGSFWEVPPMDGIPWGEGILVDGVEGIVLGFFFEDYRFREVFPEEVLK
jgi:hypothetical protein